jgi:uncharacterized protein YcbX
VGSTVVELWRYPVKSLLGERVEHLALDARGAVGDRAWAVVGRDGKFGSGKTTRRFRRMPGLLTVAARVGDGDVPVLVFADGEELAADSTRAALRMSDVVGEPVTIEREGVVPHLDDGPIHLLTTASMRWLGERVPDAVIDARRFRPNVVLDTDADGLVEESWIGEMVHIGDAALRVERRAVRCVMASMAQSDLAFAPSIMRTLEAENDLNLGVYASVDTSPSPPLRIGAPVRLE